MIPDSSSRPRGRAAIATGAYVLLVVVGKQDGAATAGSLAALLTGVLAALSALGREE
ncbi:hypothetical protein [Streptomyces sp. BK022]|uniref:hypothetical protein n=1 Tax=Streptomyces sp. BK022 TaxID=2512123 RepID=UPI0013EF132D|nr:hypothetical protein [Streptomyces sp. BK022]